VAKRKKTKKQLKEERRVMVQRERQRKNWKPPKGMVIFADKY
jgi:hypothetical protein